MTLTNVEILRSIMVEFYVQIQTSNPVNAHMVGVEI